MRLKHYELICLVISLFLGYEYAVFNNIFETKSVIFLINQKYFSEYKINLDPTPGYPLSYLLGWLGFSIMLTTNPYIIRKRISLFHGLGRLNGWLEFHIFCGLLGPILIIFHSNFKVNGLVAISFWSMIICSSSGIVGRYFYVQTLKKKDDIKRDLIKIKNDFSKKFEKQFDSVKIDEIFQYACVASGANNSNDNVLSVFVKSLTADIKLMFTNLGEPFGLSPNQSKELKTYGVENRRIVLIAPFTKLLGYWHAFHLPFAFFMYSVAIIHIVVALLFGIKR